MSTPEPSQQRWLTIVGIGEDGPDGLGPAQADAIAGADLVFGGARHLRLAAALIRGEARAWQSPFARSVEEVLAARGRRITVLASGDPFLFGIGATLARHVPAAEMRVFPAPSAFSLAASRMGWALAETICLSLHGRPLDLVRPALHPGARILALTSDEAGPAALAALLEAEGFGASRLTVLEALGGPDERLRSGPAAGFTLTGINRLNLCAIEITAGPGARILPLTPGRADGIFEHDGQITKADIRAMTLAALAPRRGELLWDIGAGSGAIGIEWMLADPSLAAIAIERDAARAARIRANALRCGVPGLSVVEGAAPEALSGLPTPDVIFIGGGGTVPGVMEAALAGLKPGGRLVANAVTAGMEALLLGLQARMGGSLTRIAITRLGAVGAMSGWRPAMPVTQWAWTSPLQDGKDTP